MALATQAIPAVSIQLAGTALLQCSDKVKKLESSVFNNVSLGQWEVARASLTQLAAAEDQTTRENARELLKILIVEAANYWSESVAIPSPHHLSWLAFNAYQELFTGKQEQLPAYLQDLIEFRLLLYLCDGVATFSSRVATQLCQYHAIHVLKIPGAISDSVPRFTGLVVSFIHDVITTVSPALGHALITSLSVPKSSSHLANNESLQLIYLECINDCLDLLVKITTRESSPEPDSSYDSQYESDHPTTGKQGTKRRCEKIVSLIHTLLSLLDPSQDMVKLTKKMDSLFHTLLRKSYVITSEVRVSFTTGEIYACLLGRSTPFLINRLHEVEEYLRLHPEPKTTPTTDTTPLKPCLPHTTQGIRQQWRWRFHEALNDHRHMLENVLEQGLQLVLTGQLQELSGLLSRHDCLPLRPLMLLMGWDKYPAAGSGKELLDILWPVEKSISQRLLFNGCCKLAFQVELVQWCLEKAKPHLHQQSSFTVHRAGEMFKGLETHSTLYVLHHYTPLASLNPAEVVDILKMRPRVPLITSSAVTPPPQFSRGTTPMKLPSDSDSLLVQSPTNVQKSFPIPAAKSLHPEQKRDISIFHSFCAIRLVLDAVWTSVEISNGTLLKSDESAPPTHLPHIIETKTESRAARKLEFGSSPLETEAGPSIKHTTNSEYSFRVIENLQAAKVCISQIEPLNYRLEILENIFSLLFLTSSDIKPLNVNESSEPGKEHSSRELEGPSRWTDEFSATFQSVALIRSKAGFLLDERMASDLLLLMQDCINELRAAKFQQSQHSGWTDEGVTSAIPSTSLQQRSAQLEQYINEAKWRLQLISSKSGILIGQTKNLTVGLELFSSSDESISDGSESEVEEETKKERKKPKKTGIVVSQVKEDIPQRTHYLLAKRSPSPYRPPSPKISSLPAPRPWIRRPPKTPPKVRKVQSPVKVMHEDSGEYADVEERSPDTPLKKKKRRLSRSSQLSLRKRRGRLMDQSESSTPRGSFICQMLATPDSLLRMCIKHGNYSRAKEVVKTFNMSGEFGAFFVEFSQQYELISMGISQRSLSSSKRTSAAVSGSGSHSHSTPRSHSHTPPRGVLEPPELESSLSTINLQLAIKTATTRSETLESLHRLLAPSYVKQMLFSGDKALEKAAEDSCLLQSLSQHVPVLVMLDIVCTNKLEPVTAKRIVELATSRSMDILQSPKANQRDSRRLSQTHDVLNVGGPFVLLQLFSDVLRYFMTFGVVTYAPTLIVPPYSSPYTLLTGGDHPLQVNAIVQSKTFSDNYRNSREKVETELLEFSSESTKELFQELSESTPLEEPSSFTPHIKTTPVSVFDELIRALSPGKHTVGVSLQEEFGEGFNYLWQFVRYVSKLLEFLARCLGLGGACPTKASLLLTLLQESPSEVLGRLVFEQGISPQRLEGLMYDFSHLRIVEVLVKCCCPRLPSTDIQTHMDPTDCSLVALNVGSLGQEVGVVTDLCSFSHDLLSKLLSVIKNMSHPSHSRDSTLTVKDLSSAFLDSKLFTLIQKTHDLTSVDLRTLDTPTKQLVFYSNIVNVLYIHAVLLAVAMETKPSSWEGLEKLSALFNGRGLSLEAIQSSQIIHMTYFTKVGYIIGQLGLISCYDLHHTVLRKGRTPPSLVKGVEISPRINPLSPDPWADYAPLTFDPRLVFVLHDGRLSSPTPVALTTDNMDDKLSMCEVWYLSSAVSVDPQNSSLSVPEWLYEARRELINESVIDDISLLRYVRSKLDKEKADSFIQLLIEASELLKAKKLSVDVQPSSPQIGYNFMLKQNSSNSKMSPQPQQALSKKSTTKQVVTAVVLECEETKPRHTFTPQILQFIEDQAPLLAALVHLLSPPLTAQSDSYENLETLESTAEDSTGASGKRSLIQTLRNRVTRSSNVTPSKREVVTKQPQDWNVTYQQVLSHFSTAQPMCEYLVARLSPFNSLIDWDDPLDKCPEFRVCLRSLAALPSSSDRLSEACNFVLRRLLEEGRVMEAVIFLRSEPVSKHWGQLSNLSELVLSCAFVSNYLKSSTDPSQKNPLSILSQISNPELASRLTLTSLKYWSVAVCKDLLSYCFNHLSPDSLLSHSVREKLDCLRNYSHIMMGCESPLHMSKSPLANWYDIAEDSSKRPEYVLRMLLSSKVFDTAREWAVVHHVSRELSQQIEVEYLSHLLDDPSDPITALQVLDGLSEDSTALQVCESLLEHADLNTTIFVLHYTLTCLGRCLHFAKTQDYSNKLLGARALLCIPKEHRKTYKSLILQPMLLLEQLLIDMKIEWASSVIQHLRANEHVSHINKMDIPILEHIPVTFSEVKESHDPFLQTIMHYCIKALEFPQPILVQNTPAHSVAVTAISTQPGSPGVGGQFLLSNKPIPMDQGSIPYNSDGLYPPSTPRRASFSHSRRPSMRESFLESFRPPPEPPSREQWIRDSDVRKCPICQNVVFGMFNRRHHCRRCGRVICSDCSTHLAKVKGYDLLVRVCNDCHKMFEVSESPSDANPTTHHDFDIHSLLLGSENRDESLRNYTLLPGDPMFNQNVRKEFCYERAPNTALFLSLVDLLVDKQVAAGFILDCCHTVSMQLVPNAQGLVNEEVDHHFVIGLIQNLLQNAKLRFAQAEDSSGVELCDTYLSRVELLRLLVASQCPKIPSIQELTKPDLARRVRDKLMQDNRFKLAMEVSTKCQLDSGEVLAAWGIACLKCGNFQGARAKFKNCFQVSSHSKLSSSGSHNLQLLQRIVELIEQTPFAVNGKSSQYNEDWSSLLMSSTAIPERYSDECDLDKSRFNECIHYLTQYGNHSSLIAFYVKHGCWSIACQTIREKNCSVEVFIDHLWVPALKTGQIDYVEECLQRIDHTLSTWEGYLTAACRYFTQKGLFSVLYKTQLFMKDYIRAGMTCIKFFIGFSGRSTTVTDLYSRLHYLGQAKGHFQSYLDVNRRMGERKGGWSRVSRHVEEASQVLLGSVKTLEVSEVQQHVATIEMQIRVTSFLYQSAETHTAPNELPDPPLSGRGSSGPPTLFSNAQVRTEVATQLLTASHDIIEGFEFAREVIQAYRLSSNEVYCATARALSLRHRHGDLRVLLQCLQKAHTSQSLYDDVIMVSIKVLANQPKEAKYVDKLASLLSNEKSQIKAYVMCGKLKNAYLVAVKYGEVEEVRHISELAGKAGQITVRDICEKWLQDRAGHR